MTMSTPKLSYKFATMMKKRPQFQRPLVAKNYDTVSFDYRKIGRWQVRFIKTPSNPLRMDLYLNGQSRCQIQRYDSKPPTMKDLLYQLDLHIENDRKLYLQARRRT